MISGVNVLRELEELRSILDTPNKTFSVDSRRSEADTPGDGRVPGYSYALNYAEVRRGGERYNEYTNMTRTSSCR